MAAETHQERLQRVRQATQEFACPACGAAPGMPCVGGGGQQRKANHKQRLALYRNSGPEEMSEIEWPDGYVVYAIKDPRDGTVVYVGQTKSMWKRYRAHLRTGRKPRRRIQTDNITTWLHDLMAEELMPIFEVLETCVSEDHSLQQETAWIRKLVVTNPGLLNRWREHRKIIKAEDT